MPLIASSAACYGYLVLKDKLYFYTPYRVLESHGKHATKGTGKPWKNARYSVRTL